MAVEEGLARVERRAQGVRVGQVSVVDQVDAQRGIDEERLRLAGGQGAGRWVPDVTDAHVACARKSSGRQACRPVSRCRR